MASILMVAGEGLPFIKTGGLADVIGSLPKALTERGHEVKVVMPLYKKISDKYYNELHFDCEYSVSINYTCIFKGGRRCMFLLHPTSRLF